MDIEKPSDKTSVHDENSANFTFKLMVHLHTAYSNVILNSNRKSSTFLVESTLFSIVLAAPVHAVRPEKSKV